MWLARHGDNDDDAEDWEKPPIPEPFAEHGLDWSIWQYTSEHRTDGVENRVDLNLADGEWLRNVCHLGIL